ncbi:MAG: DMT family transporter [Bacteroidales bacterium]|jgi:drug/metabolite transporter (DMT)-like permease|nr:DMT family transporter [Bacteroidales bacterium]
MRTKLYANLAILGANLLYGVNYIAVKEILPEHASWQALALLRGVGALVLFSLGSFFINTDTIERKDMWKLAIAGFLGVTVNQSLLVWGIELSSPVNASIIMTLNPLFVMIMSAIVLQYPITRQKIAGIILGGLGAVMLIVTSRYNEFTGAHIAGDLIILSNAIMYGLYLVWTKPLMKKYGSFTVLKYMFMFGVVPVFFYGGPGVLQIDIASLSPVVIGAFVFVIVGATFLTYMLNIIGLKHVNPTTVSIYIYIQPIVATIISVFLGQDFFSWYKVLSMVLVFVGVYLVTQTNKGS